MNVSLLEGREELNTHTQTEERLKEKQNNFCTIFYILYTFSFVCFIKKILIFPLFVGHQPIFMSETTLLYSLIMYISICAYDESKEGAIETKGNISILCLMLLLLLLLYLVSVFVFTHLFQAAETVSKRNNLKRKVP